jgi:hypothetical protein
MMKVSARKSVKLAASGRAQRCCSIQRCGAPRPSACGPGRASQVLAQVEPGSRTLQG